MRFVFAATAPAALGGLPAALKKAGHEVAIILPFEAGAAKVAKATRVRLHLRVGAQSILTTIHQASSAQRVACYVAKPEHAPTPGSASEGIWFSQAVIELARRLTPTPDALVLAGWQPGLAPVYNHAWHLPFSFVQLLDFQTGEGSFGPEEFALTNLAGEYFAPSGVEFHGHLHFLKSALLHADRIVVPGGLAFRTMTESRGQLGPLLAELAGKTRAIAWPLSTEEGNPATDATLTQKYRAASPSGKAICRTALLEKLGLKPEPRGSILLLDRALTAHTLGPILDRLLGRDLRLVVARARTPEDAALEIAARRNPGQIAFLRDDQPPGPNVLTGVDATLLPERLTPASLEALETAQRFGVIPIVSAQQGLEGLCTDLRPLVGTGDAIICRWGDTDGWWDALGVRLQGLTRVDALRHGAVQRAMERAAARSWAGAAAEFPAAITH
ncbi:MAG: glycogen/starch synthase [Verrucomicrobia bacterium]|nr:glycogen/starch synthase [Verrucomicrobiota bacterium]